VVLSCISCTPPPILGDSRTPAPSPVASTTTNNDSANVTSLEQFWFVPQGIFVPPGDERKYSFDGLYSSVRPIDPNCCWMEPNSRIHFIKAAFASHIFLTVNVMSDVPLYRKKPPFIKVMLDGKLIAIRTCLPLGDSRIPIVLPPKYRRGTGPYTLLISTSKFVPAEQGMNGDTRSLGLILKRIETS
jgi:hypothetical protein